MTVSYNLEKTELTQDWVDSVKALFQGKTINITVTEVPDETEYLLSSPANKSHLEKSIKDIADGKGIVMTLDDFKERYS